MSAFTLSKNSGFFSSRIKINVASKTAKSNTIKISESISNFPAEFKTGEGCSEKYIRGKIKTKKGMVSTLKSEYTAETLARAFSFVTAALSVKYAP